MKQVHDFQPSGQVVTNTQTTTADCCTNICTLVFSKHLANELIPTMREVSITAPTLQMGKLRHREIEMTGPHLVAN